MPFNPRFHQKKVLEYRQGKMGVAAVPGSGKTQTLSYLAATLLAEGRVRDDQEILIVTLVNSAVENFASRINGFIQEMGFIPGIGYRVRTLHGLAHDIIRERPDLAMLPNQFTIIDERVGKEILTSAVNNWLNMHPEFMKSYLKSDIPEGKQSDVRRKFYNLMLDIADSFIRTAKDLEYLPDDINHKLNNLQTRFPLLDMGYAVYRDYQRSLSYRSAIDFSDLIRLALHSIQSDVDFLQRLQHRWVYVLEDEAQDSSALQEKTLSLLTGENGNWVRVGDPNQAIFETFTTANPKYLVDFLNSGVIENQLPVSGRSTHSIIWLANQLVDWSVNEHPNPAIRSTGLYPYQIQRTPPGDPQPNPEDRPDQIYLYTKDFEAENELKTIARSIKKWIEEPQHQGETVAALVTSNRFGSQLIEQLHEMKVPYLELLENTIETREVVDEIGSVLTGLANPTRMDKLIELYERLTRFERTPILPRIPSENPEPYELEDYIQTRAPVQKATAQLLRKCRNPEEYLYPHPANNWVESLDVSPEILFELEWFRQMVTRWQRASILPIDQLVLSISQDIYTRPADLALSHKLALMLEQYASSNPESTLEDFANVVVSISDSRLTGFSENDTGFNPDDHPGEVVVTTVHKAKGLEWDRVYLLSVNSYDYPAGLPGETYYAEKYYIRDQLNLQAETLAKFKALMNDDQIGLYLEDGEATRNARLDQAAERLRVLYVGITRARKELVITFNTGRLKNNRAAEALLALADRWNRRESNATTI